jgi:hypothetical protein
MMEICEALTGSLTGAVMKAFMAEDFLGFLSFSVVLVLVME